jgi:hypothetical protein
MPRRRVFVPTSAALAALLGLALAPAEGTNTTDDDPMVVLLYDGKKHEGAVVFLKDRIDVKGQKKGRIRYKDVAGLQDPPPPTDDDLTTRRGDFAKKAAALETDAASTADAWAKLGRWAAEQELAAEAKVAFERALALDLQQVDSRHALGQLLGDDGQWVDAAPVIAAKRRKGTTRWSRWRASP